MADPDPVTTGVAIGLTIEAIKRGESFIAALAGKPGKDIGTILAEFTRQRIENVQSIGNKAGLTLLNLQPQQVSLSFLHPALEAASLQDDPSLQETWANLFANAADPRQETPVGPKFVYMLRDLGPREIKFLDALYLNALRRLETESWYSSPAEIHYSMAQLRELYGTLGYSAIKNFNEPTFDEQQRPDYRAQKNAFYLMLDVIRSNEIVRHIPISAETDKLYSTRSETIKHVFGISDLGVAFIRRHAERRSGHETEKEKV